ncbi:MAG TPA: glycosyltransferase family 4 protein [Anaerolineales bacterium]|nr:glycosyltransferase family 4 protein [Anaerolineales bacterium]
MKIAFVTPYYDPRNIRRGSGTFYTMGREMERQGCSIEYIGPLTITEPFSTRLFRAVTRRILNGQYKTYLDPAMARSVGKAFDQVLSNLDADLVLTNDPGIVAGMRSELPVVYYSDVILPFTITAGSVRENASLSGTSLIVLKYFQLTIKRCLKNARLCIFPADWLKREAAKYGTDPGKLAVIPFGANIPDPGDSVSIHRDFNFNVQKKKVDLLFIGRDWQRKGGEIAVKVASDLRDLGVNTILHIVGAEIKDPPSYVHVHGLLNKDDPADWEIMDRLFRESDVLILPSHGEGSVIVPREAAAYGLPTLAYKIDGIMASVSDGVSGVLLQHDAPAADFSSIIMSWFTEPEQYRKLSIGARHFFEENADWQANVGKLISALNGAIQVPGD